MPDAQDLDASPPKASVGHRGLVRRCGTALLLVLSTGDAAADQACAPLPAARAAVGHDDPCQAASPEERFFLAENEAAMARMMSAMAVEPTGDVDRDFVAMMVPHH